jgi:hypothetical protein
MRLVLETKPPAWFTKKRCHLNHNQIVKDPRKHATLTPRLSFRCQFDRGRVPQSTRGCPRNESRVKLSSSNACPEQAKHTIYRLAQDLSKGKTPSWQKFFPAPAAPRNGGAQKRWRPETVAPRNGGARKRRLARTGDQLYRPPLRVQATESRKIQAPLSPGVSCPISLRFCGSPRLDRCRGRKSYLPHRPDWADRL